MNGSTSSGSTAYTTVAASREVPITANVQAFLAATQACNTTPSNVQPSFVQSSTALTSTVPANIGDRRLTKGSKAGIGASAVFLAVVVLVTILFLRRRRRRSSSGNHYAPDGPERQDQAHFNDSSVHDVRKDISHLLNELEAPQSVLEMPAFRDPAEMAGEAIDTSSRGVLGSNDDTPQEMVRGVRSPVSSMSTTNST